jgi:hypothetical protein
MSLSQVDSPVSCSERDGRDGGGGPAMEPISFQVRGFPRSDRS